MSRTATTFPDYNVRKYLERRVLGVLEETLKSGTTEAKQAAMQKAERDLPMWQRQAVVYEMYRRPHKSVMVRISAPRGGSARHARFAASVRVPDRSAAVIRHISQCDGTSVAVLHALWVLASNGQRTL